MLINKFQVAMLRSVLSKALIPQAKHNPQLSRVALTILRTQIFDYISAGIARKELKKHGTPIEESLVIIREEIHELVTSL